MTQTKASSSSTVSRALPSDTTIAVAPDKQVDVRVYGRKTGDEVLPLVVHFHGGAFTSGDLDSGCTVANLLQEAGACVISVAYPLAPKHPFPQPLEIGYGVLQWAFKNRTRLAGKGAPLYLAGEEAGGNLAAGVCMIARDQFQPPVAGQILVSPMLDPCAGTASLRALQGEKIECKFADGWQSYLSCGRDAEHPYAVPARTQRLAGLPPSLILMGEEDPMRDEALAYAARLESGGLTVFQHVFNKVEEWPQALLEAPPPPCPCAAEVLEQFRKFFEVTRCQLTR